MKFGLPAAALLATIAAAPALAGEEPYGQGFAGWKFTQHDDRPGRINCRALLGSNLMSMSTDGGTYVSTTSPIPKGNYEESSVVFAGSTEMVNAWSGGVGGRLVLYVDQDTMGKIAWNGSYTWRVAVGNSIKTGTVIFNNSALKAFQRMKECVAANGG